MKRWNLRLFSLVLLTGVSAGGLYYSGRTRLEKVAADLLGSQTSIGSMRLGTGANVTAITDVKAAATRFASLHIPLVRLTSATTGLISQHSIDRAIATDVELAGTDAWSESLDRISTSLATQDPSVKDLPELVPFDAAEATEQTLAPILASWRAEWQNVLQDYRSQIDHAVLQSDSAQDLKTESNNPLRDRETLKNQIESISELSEQLEKLGQELEQKQQSLASKADELTSRSTEAFSERVRQHENEQKDQQRQRLALNLESVRKQMFARMLELCSKDQHIAANLISRSADVLTGEIDRSLDRGSSMLESFGAANHIAINCLEVTGSCDQDALKNSFMAAFYRDEGQTALSSFVVVLPKEERRTTRIVGEIDKHQTAQFSFAYPTQTQKLKTDLLTEPNFELVLDQASLDVDSTLDQQNQSLEIRLSSPNVSLKPILTDPVQQPAFAMNSIDESDCTANLTIKLTDQGTIESVVEYKDNFFDKLHQRALDAINQSQSQLPGLMAMHEASVRTKIQLEMQAATSQFEVLAANLNSRRANASQAAERLATKLAPTRIRTATNNTLNDR